MPYVPIPKDLNAVKTKVAFKQIISCSLLSVDSTTSTAVLFRLRNHQIRYNLHQQIHRHSQRKYLTH